ncbi:NLPA lipoprotein [Clostridium sp. DL-VIII]|uniref:MetQ/NlpA family ABC transporter substrate-binding protein n=1 Tax=Clostridium sp. DL-VIII TaxID=641107 RepID=UPI00023B03A1|nr:MetQ/NlpA family ABC transporter substrate-binding protein [Clostridium sp. DL-VIII]EHJ01831.1 NLPA lipoprotein [Clostridium sp. DL-VIII]
MNKRIFMKSMSFILFILTIIGSFIGCSNKTQEVEKNKPKEEIKIKVGTTSDEPRVWEAVEKKLESDGIKIEIVNFANGANPNQALADGEIDLNAFQHYAYFNKNIKDLNLDLTAIGDTIIVPLNLFSKNIKSISELKSGAKIGVPNDVTNEGRALLVLQKAGIIKVKAGSGQTPGLADVESNPLNIEFVELPGAQLPRSLNDVDAAIINCGYAVDAGLDLKNDVIFSDKVDINSDDYKPYINIIAARTKDKDNETYKKIVKAYNSDEVKEAIKEVYKGAALPAWK